MSATRGERFRVRLRLSPGADADAVLAAAGEALGRPVEALSRLRTASVLSLMADRAELEALLRLPGVAQAEPEGCCELPPRPTPRRERE